MRKYISLFLCALLTLSVLTGCVGKNTDKNSDKIKIVATIFPIYDWVKNIVGDIDTASLELLSKNGVDMHSFQPTVDDMVTISTCDVFIYIGGESNKWVDDAIKEAANKNMLVLNLLDILGDSAKEEETIEGMEGHDHDQEHNEGEIDKPKYDEHIWLSVKNAKLLVAEIAEALSQADTKSAEKYRTNGADYIRQLDFLENKFSFTASNATKKTLLFADRFPFRYLTDDYGLTYYAAFDGCSAETETSFETVTFLANKIDELNLPAVLTIDGSDKKIAQTVVNNTKAKSIQILTLDSLQSTTLLDAENGVTYIGVMDKNLVALKAALGG